MTVKELKAALEGVADDTPVEVIAANHFHPVESARKGFINRLGTGEKDGPVFVVYISTNPAEFIHQGKKWHELQIRDIVWHIERVSRSLYDLERLKKRISDVWRDERVWHSENPSTSEIEKCIQPLNREIDLLETEKNG